MKKRLFSAFLATVIAFSLTACGGEEEKADSPQASDTASTSKLTEESTENTAETEAPTLHLADVETKDPHGIAARILADEWVTSSVEVSGLGEFTAEEYAEIGGVEVSDFEMTIDFKPALSVDLTSAEGTESGTYEVLNEDIIITDEKGNTATFGYDIQADTLYFDMLGDGSIIMKFSKVVTNHLEPELNTQRTTIDFNSKRFNRK